MAATITTVPADTCIYGLEYVSEGEKRMQQMHSVLYGGGGSAAAAPHRPPGPLDPLAALCWELVAASPHRGPEAAVREARRLLQSGAVRTALRAAAVAEGEAGGPATDALVHAAWAGRGDLVTALVGAGARVTVHSLAAAFPLRLGPAAFPDSALTPPGLDPSRCSPLQAVRLLLAHGGGGASAQPLLAGAKPHWHPLLRLVADFKAERGELSIRVSETSEEVTRRWFNDRLKEWEAAGRAYLQIAEALVEAGWSWPTVLHSVEAGGRTTAVFDPLSEPGVQRFLEGDGRWLFYAMTQTPWAPARHPAFPARFRAAARALLLAARRHTGELLPPAAAAAVLRMAAYLLSAWQPQMVEGAAAADSLFRVFTESRSLDAMSVEMKVILPGGMSMPTSMAGMPGVSILGGRSAQAAAGVGGSAAAGMAGGMGGGFGGLGGMLAGLFGGGMGRQAAAGGGAAAQAAGNTAAGGPPAQARCCAQCGSLDGKLRRCARCRGPYYCSKACQKAAWPQHRTGCAPPSPA
ncbi:hypothetical protein ABPG75_009920 [Micractinium tetrahymenae]